MESLEAQVARIDEKVDAIEKIIERVDSRTSALEQSYFQIEFTHKNISDIAKEVIKISNQQGAFRSFVAGIGFAFSVLATIVPYLLKRFMGDGN